MYHEGSILLGGSGTPPAGSRDYEAAVAKSPLVRHELGSTPMSALWAPTLVTVMQHHGIAIAEEAVAALSNSARP